MQSARENKLISDNPLVIIDAGALGGVSERWNDFNYKAVLFEPNTEAYNELLPNKPENITILNSALSDSNREVSLHICRKPAVSSVYAPNTDLLNKFGNPERFDVLKTLKMKADALDNVLRGAGISDVDHIKVDVQGHELPILKGATGTLENVVGVETEVEFTPMYKEQPLFAELDPFMRQRGFELFRLGKMNHWKRKENTPNTLSEGQLIWTDAIYFRTPENILGMKKIYAGKIVRAILVYLAYGYSDFAQILLAKQKILADKERGEMRQIIDDFDVKQKQLRRAKRLKKYLGFIFR